MFKARTIGILISLGLLVSGAVILLRIPFFYIHSHLQGQRLIVVANKQEATVQTDYHPVSHVNQPKAGSLIGTINISALSLQAPIVQGTTEDILNHGAGHLVTSVMPGEVGASVIAAHNATWFRHIDELKPGNAIDIETSYGKFIFHVTSSKIVHTGDPVYNTSEASLVLEACYPLDALYLTPYRYLVYAKLDSSGSSAPTQHQWTYPTYYAAIPSALVQQGLALSTNSLPMGTMSYIGTPSKSYTESESPLSASDTLVQLYLAWLHASSHQELGDLTALVPGSENNPFIGVPLSEIHYSSLFNETLNVEHASLVSISAVTHPYVPGMGHYIVTIKGKLNGHAMSIASLYVQKVSN